MTFHTCTRIAGLLLGLAAIAQAAVGQTLPTGGKVAAGNAAITPINPSLLTVQQSSSRAVIDWTTFSIGTGARVDFQQPGSSSAVLNLVTGTQASVIDGQLTGNGQVLLLNPAGVLVSGTGQVNTGSFIAAAATTTPAAASAWQQGSSNTLPLTSGSGSVQVQSGGQVVVHDGGYLALAGAAVSDNGTLYAKLGRVQLAGGSAFTLDFTGDGLLSVAAELTQTAPGQTAASSPVSVGPSGSILAEGGTISISARAAQQLYTNVIGIDGQLWAQNATQSGDVIVLSGSGGGVRLGSASRLDATSTASGGSIAIAADSITLEGQAVVAATGASGGGAVSLSASNSVSTAAGSQIFTNSTAGGPGGSVSVSGPTGSTLGSASLAGSIVATSGDASGASSGGSLSVSANDIAFSAPFYSTRGSAGAAPSLTLTSGDPIVVSQSATSAAASQISSAALVTALAGGADVTVSTTPGSAASIQVNDTVNGRPSAASATGGALTLQAAGDVVIADSVLSTQGSNITLTAGGVVSMQGSASLQAQSAAAGTAVPLVTVSSAASCAAAPACTTTITDVQAGGLIVNAPAGNVLFPQSLGVPTSTTAAPTLGSLTVTAAAVQLGQALQAGALPTALIDVNDALSVTAPAITAAADLKSANGAITLTGTTTLQAGVYANGDVTFNGDLILNPHRPAAVPTQTVLQGVVLGTTDPGTQYVTPFNGSTFYSAQTVTESVFQTTISSGGKGNIVFGGNVGISAAFTPTTDFVEYATSAGSFNSCPPTCLSPVVSFVVDAGTKGVTFSHGLANSLAGTPNLLVETNSPPSFGLDANGNSIYNTGVAANTVQLVETSGALPTIGSPGGTPATLFVNAFTWINGSTLASTVITPTPAIAQIAFVLPQKFNAEAADLLDNGSGVLVWTPNMSFPPASGDSSASGVPLTPVLGSVGVGSVGPGSALDAPALSGVPPAFSPQTPDPVPSAPVVETSAVAGDLTAVTSANALNAEPAPGDTPDVSSGSTFIGGPGVAAAADLGRGTPLNGAGVDIFGVRWHVLDEKPCAPQDADCVLIVDPDYLRSGVYQ